VAFPDFVGDGTERIKEYAGGFFTQFSWLRPVRFEVLSWSFVALAYTRNRWPASPKFFSLRDDNALVHRGRSESLEEVHRHPVRDCTPSLEQSGGAQD